MKTIYLAQKVQEAGLMEYAGMSTVDIMRKLSTRPGLEDLADVLLDALYYATMERENALEELYYERKARNV